MFEIVDSAPQNAVIKVIGVGGGGGNAVEHMVKQKIEGVEFVCANTDAQALTGMGAPTLLQLGDSVTRGLGAGANPVVGKEAALEDRDRIKDILSGTDMVFIAAGMGGGTGTGAAPIVADMAKELGILTVAVVTRPFDFEGKKRMTVAEEGILELSKNVDSFIRSKLLQNATEFLATKLDPDSLGNILLEIAEDPEYQEIAEAAVYFVEDLEGFEEAMVNGELQSVPISGESGNAHTKGQLMSRGRNQTQVEAKMTGTTMRVGITLFGAVKMLNTLANGRLMQDIRNGSRLNIVEHASVVPVTNQLSSTDPVTGLSLETLQTQAQLEYDIISIIKKIIHAFFKIFEL